MIHKLHSSEPGHVRIIFELPACIWADRIFLTGDFNDWAESSLPMQQDRNGVWRTELDLPVGRQYEFRYIIDGHWRTDYHADGFTLNRFGTENSLIMAELPPTPVTSNGNASLVREQNRLTIAGLQPSASRTPKAIAAHTGFKSRTIEHAA